MRSSIIKIACLLILAGLIIEGYNLSRPLPTFSASLASLPSTAAGTNLPWPAGQSAIGTDSDGVLASNGAITPLPTGSIAKVITALCVLKVKPLAAGEQGPIITLSASDVSIYQTYVAEDGSVVPVTAGEQISEYEALQAMMLPSANNIAESLAIWAFGSLPAYESYANNFVKTIGMTQTAVADASGFSPQTVSTAPDLVKLGQAALKDPVLSDIVSQRLASTPNFGTIYNVNYLLGRDGIIGIKTGNTDQAGGCYLFAAKRTVHGLPVTVIGAVLGDKSLNQAITDGQSLVTASDNQFQSITINKGEAIGAYKTPWGQQTEAVAQKETELLAWRGQAITTKSNLKRLSTVQSGANVGSVEVSAGAKSITVPVVAKSFIKNPPLFWRLTHF